MFESKRLHRPGWLSGAFHFVILFVAIESESAEVWPYALFAMALVSFFAWAANYRRYRQIHDLPTSRIASAAQGYVELFGRAEMLPGVPVSSRLSRQPCCWYHFEIEEKTSDNKWRTVDSGASVEQFLLIDSTGQCVVSPQGAEVLSQSHRCWTEGDRRYTESLLLPRCELYAIGAFSTVSVAAASAGEERADVGKLLGEWKADQRTLLGRFDLDKDGKIDLKEWELARLQAQREVRKQHAETHSRGIEGVHLLRKPADGRLFLLANEMPDRIGARYRWWSWVHLAVFIGTGSAGLILL
jgi:hypothetical protein